MARTDIQNHLIRFQIGNYTSSVIGLEGQFHEIRFTQAHMSNRQSGV